MGNREKVLEDVLRGSADANILSPSCLAPRDPVTEELMHSNYKSCMGRLLHAKCRPISVIVVVLLLLWDALSAASSQEAINLPDRPYATGQLIVKFKGSVTECAHCLFRNARPFQQATLDLSDSLDRLYKKYHVYAVTPLFRTETEDRALRGRLFSASLTTLTRFHREKLDRVASKFSLRTARAPKNMKPPDLAHVYLLALSQETDIELAVEEFVRDPHVEYAQPNYRVTVQWTPNDPYYASSGSWGQTYDDLWALKADKLNMEDAWEISRGQSIVVAVLDSGIDYTHADISENIWSNSGEIADNGSDDDGNGFIDDVRGWDFYNNDHDPQDDDLGHGTLVGGIIAAIGDNAEGIIGVAHEAQVMAIKGLGEEEAGFLDDVAQGLIYAADNGADIINNSWGCDAPCPSNPAVEDAVSYAHGLGAVLIFAAGNNSDDVADYSPQNLINPKPIVVSATNHLDTPAYFTNYGFLIDIAAPGGGTLDPPPIYEPERNILSLKSSLCGVESCDPNLIVGTNYLRQAGTSFSAPYAAGAAALVLAHRPTFMNDEVRQVLRVSAHDVHDQGFDQQTGMGRLNAANALTIESALRVQITSPLSGSTFDPDEAAIAVAGTAAGDSFQQYELFYGLGLLPQEWTAIGAPVTTPVENGTLGSWDLAGLQNGSYLLKLVATSMSSLQFQEIVSVVLERPAKRITGSDTQGSPEIDGEYIVYSDGTYGQAEIVLYDITTLTEHQITVAADQQDHPAISGTKIVWQDNRSGNWDIYFCEYDAETSTCPERQITTDSAIQWEPRIEGNLIVWEDYRNEIGVDVYLYDLATNQEIPITNDTISQYHPVVSGNRVVWSDKRHGGWDVYSCDYDPQTGLCPEQRITDDISDPSNPEIFGDNIVWIDERNGAPDLYLYNLVAGSEQQITSSGGVVILEGADLDEDQVVWADERNGNQDIYLYHLISGVEEAITVNAADQHSPKISGERIVFSDRNYGGDVYLYGPNEAPALTPIGSNTIQEGQVLSFSVTAKDLEGDSLTFLADPLPTGASFSNQAFSWTPSYSQGGDYNIIFTVTDGQLSDQELVTITVLDEPVSIVRLQAKPKAFSPNDDGTRDATSLIGTFNHWVTWELRIQDSVGASIRTFVGYGTDVNEPWDGTDDTGMLMPDGVYTFVLTGTDEGGSSASQSGLVTVDTMTPIVSDVNDVPDPFRPQMGEMTTISFTLSEPVFLTLRVFNSQNRLVRVLIQEFLSAPTNSVEWDGKNGQGNYVSPGIYTYALWAKDSAGNSASSFPVINTVTVE